MRTPKRYLAAILVVALLATIPGMAFLGIPPFNSVNTFLAVNAASLFILLVFGVIGGAFVGMILAHRILANRDFTPYERTVLESLQQIRERLDALEKQSELVERKR